MTCVAILVMDMDTVDGWKIAAFLHAFMDSLTRPAHTLYARLILEPSYSCFAILLFPCFLPTSQFVSTVPGTQHIVRCIVSTLFTQPLLQ